MFYVFVYMWTDLVNFTRERVCIGEKGFQWSSFLWQSLVILCDCAVARMLKSSITDLFGPCGQLLYAFSMCVNSLMNY